MTGRAGRGDKPGRGAAADLPAGPSGDAALVSGDAERFYATEIAERAGGRPAAVRPARGAHRLGADRDAAEATPARSPWRRPRRRWGWGPAEAPLASSAAATATASSSRRTGSTCRPTCGPGWSRRPAKPPARQGRDRRRSAELFVIASSGAKRHARRPHARTSGCALKKPMLNATLAFRQTPPPAPFQIENSRCPCRSGVVR